MFVKNPEYFLTIVKERSISKAAERLYLSQPYLSQYLAKLGVVPMAHQKHPLLHQRLIGQLSQVAGGLHHTEVDHVFRSPAARAFIDLIKEFYRRYDRGAE